MKTRAVFSLLLLVVSVVLVSCMVAGGRDPVSQATWGIGMVGTDADDLDVKPTGLHGKKINQSKGLKIVADTVLKMWKSYLLEKGLEYIAGQYFTLEGAKVASAQAIELEKLRNAASVAEAEAQLAILNATPIP